MSGHPRRSAVALFVTSNSTAFAEVPRPPHVLSAKGEKPHPLASHGGPSVCTFLVSALLQCLVAFSSTSGCSASPTGYVQTKSTATCCPRDQLRSKMSAGRLPARHSASFSTATPCRAHIAWKASRNALCRWALPFFSQQTK